MATNIIMAGFMGVTTMQLFYWMNIAETNTAIAFTFRFIVFIGSVCFSTVIAEIITIIISCRYFSKNELNNFVLTKMTMTLMSYRWHYKVRMVILIPLLNALCKEPPDKTYGE